MWLVSRETMIALAVMGAIASMLAAILRGNGYLTARGAGRLSALGYALMTASMVVFIVAGLRSAAG